MYHYVSKWIGFSPDSTSYLVNVSGYIEQGISIAGITDYKAHTCFTEIISTFK
ncbi:hypothetical protein NXX23_26485 [Bacteroides ovatus]|nr:hypothetical protein [Bacteroides ovatus]